MLVKCVKSSNGTFINHNLSKLYEPKSAHLITCLYSINLLFFSHFLVRNPRSMLSVKTTEILQRSPHRSSAGGPPTQVAWLTLVKNHLLPLLYPKNTNGCHWKLTATLHSHLCMPVVQVVRQVAVDAESWKSRGMGKRSVVILRNCFLSIDRIFPVILPILFDFIGRHQRARQCTKLVVTLVCSSQKRTIARFGLYRCTQFPIMDQGIDWLVRFWLLAILMLPLTGALPSSLNVVL